MTDESDGHHTRPRSVRDHAHAEGETSRRDESLWTQPLAPDSGIADLKSQAMLLEPYSKRANADTFELNGP